MWAIEFSKWDFFSMFVILEIYNEYVKKLIFVDFTSAYQN